LKRRRKDGVYILECDVRNTSLGKALRIQLERYDGEPMSWEAVWEAFEAKYPGKWAAQMFPPRPSLLNGANKYHLFVFEETPVGLDISQDPPPGTTWP
jgi:hypothetical protein